MNTCVKFWKKLGPGLVTGASDDDPSGIATYSQAGAALGLSLLWTAFLTYPLMYAIQEMCARIGIISKSGLGKIIRTHYPSSLSWIFILIFYPAITFNIAADLAGMGAVAHLLSPFLSSGVYIVLSTLVILIGIVFFSYQKMTFVLKWLSMTLFLYAAVPFFVKINWWEVLWATFIPHFENSKEFSSLFVAVLGTTISPYLFFWQTSMSLEEKEHHAHLTDPTHIKYMRTDVNFGMLLSNLIMFFIILATGSVLFPAGLTHIQTVEEAAQALEPVVGELAYLFFSIGVLTVGLLAIPVLAGSMGYFFADIFDWEKGMDKKPKEAVGFYATILSSVLIGCLMNLFHLDPIQALIYTAIIYGITAPLLIALILHICNQPSIMHQFTNSFFYNSLGVVSVVLMTGAAILFLYQLFN